MGLFSVSNYGAPGYLSAANQNTNGIQSLANIFGEQANQAQQAYGQYDPQYRGAVDAYARELQYDPATSQYGAAQLNNATAGIGGDTAMAQSNLYADLARRGMTGDSSMLGGGLASIGAVQNATIGNARNQIASQNYAQHLANLQQRQALLGGVAGGYYNRAQQGYGAQGGALSTAYGQNMGEANVALQRQQQAHAQMMQALSGIATVAGGAIGGMPGAQIGSSIFSGGAKGGGGNYGY
jgi:hypothetical protein